MFEKVKKLFGAQDMTTGSPVMAIAKLAFPLLIGNFAWQLYSTVDSAVVGKYCTVERNGYNGVDALLALEASSSILNLLPVLFIAISTGIGILVAQYFGAKEKEKLSVCIGTSVTLSVAVATIIMAVGLPVSRPLLILLDTPEKYLDLAAVYLQISFLGIMGVALYSIIVGIQLGLGDSLYPLLCLLASAAMNIGLDIWFVARLGWGVQGVAWATVISQTVLAVLCIIRPTHMKDIVEIKKETLSPKLAAAGSILKLGLPFGVVQVVFFLAQVFGQSLANRMGSVANSANATLMRMDGFIVLPAFTFGLAISTYIGQNLGAKKTDRLKSGERAALMSATGISMVTMLALLLFGKQLIGIFLDLLNHADNSVAVYREMVDMGGRELKILAVGYIAVSIIQMYGGILRAAGDMVSMMVISLITTVAVRMPLMYLLAHVYKSEEWPSGHPDVLFIPLLVSWLLEALLVYLRYRQGRWKNINLVQHCQINNE